MVHSGAWGPAIIMIVVASFGEEYRAYMRPVSMFIPRWGQWRRLIRTSDSERKQASVCVAGVSAKAPDREPIVQFVGMHCYGRG